MLTVLVALAITPLVLSIPQQQILSGSAGEISTSFIQETILLTCVAQLMNMVTMRSTKRNCPQTALALSRTSIRACSPLSLTQL
jgi:hypothetical protein